MPTLYSPQDRAERLIAAGRVVLATSSLFAVWLDPSEPAKYAGVAYTLLSLYVLYALAIALYVWRSDAPAGRQGLLTHAFDFTFFSLFVYFTAGPASPFTTYFVFSMVCATLRWQWRGAFWTALAALATFFGLGIYFAEVLEDPTFELTPLIVRGVYLGVIAVLLGYVGVHEQRIRREITALAAWPQPTTTSFEEAVEELVQNVAGTLDARRLVLAWLDPEEPWMHLAIWNGERLELTREPPGSLAVMVPEPLRQASFLCSNPTADVPQVLVRAGSGFRRHRGMALGDILRRRLQPDNFLSVRIESESLEGRIFVFGKSVLSSDDLLLGEVLGEIVRARLELLHLTLQLQQIAATEERIRLARDLHDGVLQSLTGIGLRLETIRRQSATDFDPVTTEQELARLQRLVSLEQRDLRFFIRELKPPTGEPRLDDDLAERLGDLVQRLELEWAMKVTLDTRGLDRSLAPALAREIYHMVREALINAVRHGRAMQADVSVRQDSDVLVLSIRDYGAGFPFFGFFTSEDLALQSIGPRTLRERAGALAGTLELDSTPSGSRVEIRLPTAEAR